MTDELLPGIHRIEIPLPRNPLRAVNSYVIRGRDRWLMVDTGMNRPECLDAMRAALAALAVDLDRTDFFITHSHSDHIGLVSELRGPSSRVFLHSADAAIVLDPNLWTGMAAEARIHGFPNPDAAVEKHPGRRYLFTGRPEFTSLSEGDTLPVGDYTFQCIETPGHTPGHLCLWEPKAGLLFSGDHVLDTITPNISGWCCGGDPLGEFLASLKKIATYDVRTILPGHRNLIPDPQRRIEELKIHHQNRLHEVRSILSRGAQTAYQVASQMAWRIDRPRWEEFPIPQQWFATGEALAHLLHLERTGAVTRHWTDGIASFSL